MKHAGPEALTSLEDVLSVVRQRDDLTERKPGIFYRKSNAFLHFHEDPAGLFADIKVGMAFERMRASTPAERIALLACVEDTLGPA
jgi:hypothetical protein